MAAVVAAEAAVVVDAAAIVVVIAETVATAEIAGNNFFLSSSGGPPRLAGFTPLKGAAGQVCVWPWPFPHFPVCTGIVRVKWIAIPVRPTRANRTAFRRHRAARSSRKAPAISVAGLRSNRGNARRKFRACRFLWRDPESPICHRQSAGDKAANARSPQLTADC